MIAAVQINLTDIPISRGTDWNHEFCFAEKDENGDLIPLDLSDFGAKVEIKTSTRTIVLDQLNGISYSSTADGESYTISLTHEQTLKINEKTARYSFYFTDNNNAKIEKIYGEIPVLDT
jgi:hypothetical protein